jgi:hypothetical protein
VTDLRALIGDVQPLSALWVDGEFRRPARTPNEGYFYTAGKAEPSVNDAGEAVDRSKLAFQYTPGDIVPWPDIEQAIIVSWHSWDVSHNRIASLDEASNTVEFKGPVTWAFEHWGPKQRYAVTNVRAALDAPGEWYVDETSGLLYYFPMPGESPATTEVVVPVLEQLLLIEGDPDSGAFVEHVELRGLTFAHTNYPIAPEGHPDNQAAYPVHAAVQARGARHVTIAECEITQTCNYGVWFDAGCRNNRIVKNSIHHLGAGGVRLGVGGSPATPAHASDHNLVDNNWIHDGGLVFPEGVGVWIGRASYNRIANNAISDFYYTGVSVGWSWGYDPSSANHNVIEYNHIHGIGKGVLSDMGGIYCLGIAPGTVLNNNYIHDVESYNYGGWGIYPDEGSSDLLITNNVVHDTKTGGFHQHYGRENRVFNNIFAFAREGQVIRSREEEHVSFYFMRNIVVFDQGPLLGSTWSNENFVMDANCYWNAAGDVDFKGATLAEWQARGHDMHSVVADPKFADPASRDFRLQADSPALTLGFKPIDLTRVGLYGDPAWVARPQE